MNKIGNNFSPLFEGLLGCQNPLANNMFADNQLAFSAMPSVHIGSRTFYVQQYKGYHTVLWKEGDAVCGIVSDVHLATLLALARAATGVDSAS